MNGIIHIRMDVGIESDMFGQLRATDETNASVDDKVVLGGRCYHSIYNELERLNPHVAEKQFLNECACS